MQMIHFQGCGFLGFRESYKLHAALKDSALWGSKIKQNSCLDLSECPVSLFKWLF